MAAAAVVVAAVDVVAAGVVAVVDVAAGRGKTFNFR